MSSASISIQFIGPNYSLTNNAFRTRTITKAQVPGLTRYQRSVSFDKLAKVYYPTSKLWNEDLPIHCLPTELLSYIFLLAITPRGLERMPGRHPIARVCSVWRAIVLDTPQFWTTISNTTSQNVVELKLQRSRNVKLDFVFSSRDNQGYRRPSYYGVEPWIESSQFMKLIGIHMWRCSSVRVRVPGGHWNYRWICPDFQGSGIPRFTVEGHAPGFSWDQPTVHLPQDVRTLTLTDIDVSWQSKYFPSLICLQLSGDIEATLRDTPVRPCRSNLIAAIFRACPCLKALKLGPFRGRFSSTVDKTLKQDPITPPPCLDSLELRGPSPEFFRHVLNEIDISSLSKLIIYTINPGQNPSEIAAALCRDVGGRSLLQRAVDRANCERLTVSIGRGPTAWIKLNDTGGRIDIELLSRDSSGATNRAILGAIENPVSVKIFGKVDDSLFEYLRGASIVSDIRRRPYRGGGWGKWCKGSNVTWEWEYGD